MELHALKTENLSGIGENPNLVNRENSTKKMHKINSFTNSIIVRLKQLYIKRYEERVFNDLNPRSIINYLLSTIYYLQSIIYYPRSIIKYLSQ